MYSIMRINRISEQTSKLTLAKVRLIARLKGDGYISRTGKNKTNYYLKYESANYEEVNSFANDIRTLYGLEPKFGFHRSGKNPNKLLPLVFVRSKLIYEDIMKYGPYGSKVWCVPEEILNGSEVNKVEFIKTFAEDEGTVIIVNKQVRIYSTNLMGLEQLSIMLKSLNLESKIVSGYGEKRDVYAIVISNKYNILKFAKLIGFRSKTKNDKLNILISSFKR